MGSEMCIRDRSYFYYNNLHQYFCVTCYSNCWFCPSCCTFWSIIYRGGDSNFKTADKNVRHTGGVDTITANATLHFSTGSSGEVIATPEVLCPCGLRPPFDSRGPCCSMTCHKKYVTDVATNQTDSSLLDEITRRLQVTMTYQHTLVCAVAAHAAANDGSEFIPPAPPKL